MSRSSGSRLLVLVLLIACGAPDEEHFPDDVLRRELGLGDDDRVHTVLVTGGAAEVSDPAVDTVPAGAWVQFVSGDWLVHEVSFALDSLSASSRTFLEGSDQTSSPPLLQRDARFVVSFEGAPPGRYPYLLEGNGGPGGGLIVVVDPGGP